MHMPLQANSKYPSRLAYVVKFRRDATPESLAGRLENLVSGRQLEFTSGHTLLDCFARDLLEHARQPPVDFTADDQ